MMASRTSLVLLLGLTGASFAIGLSMRRLSHAQRQRQAAIVAVGQTAEQMHEIKDLRASRPTVEARPRPAQDVIAQVNAVLAEVGIPNQQLKSLTPESEGAAVAGSSSGQARLLQQSLRLVLEGLTPQQIGAFLVQWRSVHDIWTPTRIELMHSRTAAPSAADGEVGRGNQYDATFLLTALYVADHVTGLSEVSQEVQGRAVAFMEDS